MEKTCIFCGGAGPFSKEHVLPEWTAKLLKVKGVKVTMTKLGQQQASWGSVGSFGATVGQICVCCNNGWMNDLENHAKPILSRMILPTAPVVLQPDEQQIVASWLWKLAIVQEKPSGATYFTDTERKCLMNGDSPTSFGVRMWVAAFGSGLDANLKGGPCKFSDANGNTLNAYLMSMSIRRFAAQVLCVRDTPGLTSVHLQVVSRYNFEDAEALIWPASDHGVQWPPPAGAIDQTLFDKWHTRWNKNDS